MPKMPEQLKIACADCGRIQPDAGKGATCTYCGTSPLPSYAYPPAHPCNPVKCGCEVGKPAPLPVRARRTPVPTLKR